jgi:hypothetical protein
MVKNLLSFFILFTLAGSVFSQTPFIRNYTPEEYKGYTQNWAIVQDQRGIMYFANNDGVLEYDGTTWRTIVTPFYPRSLCIDSMGVIYVGLDGDFGYLHPDSSGILHYKSLKDKLPPKYRLFQECRHIKAIGSQVFFRSNNDLFILQNDSINILHSNTGYGSSFVVDNRFYIQKKEEGLFYFKNDNLHLLPDSKEHFYNKDVFAMLPYNNGDLLIVTHYHGVFLSILR